MFSNNQPKKSLYRKWIDLDLKIKAKIKSEIKSYLVKLKSYFPKIKEGLNKIEDGANEFYEEVFEIFKTTNTYYRYRILRGYVLMFLHHHLGKRNLELKLLIIYIIGYIIGYIYLKFKGR